MTFTWGVILLAASFVISAFGVFISVSRALHPRDPAVRLLMICGGGIAGLVMVLSRLDGDPRLATPWLLAVPASGLLAGALFGRWGRKKIDVGVIDE